MRKITLWLVILMTGLLSQINAQVQGFENTAVGDIPTGWVKSQTESDDPGFVVGDVTGYAYNGTHYLVHEGIDLAAESTSWVVSEAFHLGVDYELKFYWRGRWTSAYNFTGVYISTASNDPVANPGDFTLLKELSPANYPDTWLQWNEEEYDMRPYNNQTVYIAFKYIGDHAHDFFIDDVGVGPIPYCETPDNLSVVDSSVNSVTLHWDNAFDVDNYDIAWGELGFDPDASGVSIVTVANTNTYEVTGLTSGTFYEFYVRSACSSFNHSDWIGPVRTPPNNDNCDGAISLDVYDAFASAGHEIDGDTTFASDSGNHPTCDDTGTNLDLWYSFTVPAGETSVVVLTGGAEGSAIEAALYDSCGGTELDCQGSSSSKTFNGLTGGQTYILQVWHDDFNAGPFNIAIEKTPPAPSNDECNDAIDLTVYDAGASAGHEVVTSTVAATDSNMHPSCDDFGTNLDLWYTFTVPAGETGVMVKTGGAEGNTIEAAIYDSCGGAELDCQGQSGSKLFTGLVAGQTYTLQVWHDDSNAGPFTIALEKLPPPPSNDTCDNAMALTVFNSCQPVTVSNFNTTDSGVPDPGCGNYEGGDLWFTATVPSSGSLTVETTRVSGGINDTGMAVYSGDCNNLTLIECDDDDSPDGYFSMIQLSGRTAGETIYIRVWEYGNNNFGDFGVCVHDSSVSLEENTIAGLKLYPNPVTNTLNIKAQNDIQNISVYNISGQKVISLNPHSTNLQVDMSHLTNGVYFVKIQSNDQLTAVKVVKK